jgi:cutinase
VRVLLSRSLSILTVAGTLLAGGLCAAASASAAPASPAATSCPDVQVLFARGTFELKPIGSIVGPSFTRALEKDLPGDSVSVWGDPYAANVLQTSAGPGATDMTNELTSVASSCPDTKFVLGGYSQGASVVDIAIGIHTFLGVGSAIPTSLASRVAAVVVWGNPLGLFRQTIKGDSSLYGPISDTYCNSGDPVCGNGIDILAHLAYGANGDAAAGGAFAADEVKGTS